MAGVEKRDFDSPDETRTPDKTQVNMVHLGGTTVARFTLEARQTSGRHFTVRGMVPYVPGIPRSL